MSRRGARQAGPSASGDARPAASRSPAAWEAGLVASVEGWPSTTTWDLGSSMLAALAARELGLLSAPALEARLSTVLRTLGRLPLFAGELPNEAYDARTARMTDYANRPSPAGACEVEDASWAGYVPAGGYGPRATSAARMEVDWVRAWQPR